MLVKSYKLQVQGVWSLCTPSGLYALQAGSQRPAVLHGSISAVARFKVLS